MVKMPNKKISHLNNANFLRNLSDMLKKSTKPESNSFICIEMMMQGAKKRRLMALAAVKALDSTTNPKSNVVMFK